MKQTVNIIKGDKVDPNTDYHDALPVNMYAVQREILGAKGYMLCYPGLAYFGMGSGLDRGAVYNERRDSHFRVSGEKLILVNSSGAKTELGTITGTTQVSLPYSFNTQAVIADGKMWLYDGTLTRVTDENIGSPIDGVWIDGYYFLTDGEYLYHTELTDESAVNTLSYATAEFMPDPSLGIGIQSNILLMLQPKTLHSSESKPERRR